MDDVEFGAPQITNYDNPTIELNDRPMNATELSTNIVTNA